MAPLPYRGARNALFGRFSSGIVKLQGNGVTPLALIPSGPESAYQGNYSSFPAVTLRPPPEGNRTIPMSIFWTRDAQAPSYTVRFNARSQQVLALSQICAIHVDNTNCSVGVSILFADTQFQITLAANSEGFYPVITNSLEFLTYVATTPGAQDRTVLQILNFLPPPMAINSGTATVAGVTSIATTAPITGGPITATGTIALQTPLAVNFGGTGATTGAAALDSLSGQSGSNAGVLTRTAGAAWQLTAAGAGTVTSLSPGTGIVMSPSPITATGTISMVVPVTIANGGTGQTSAAAALTALGGAPLASPGFTGSPTAPTQAPGTANTTLATTAFVSAAIVTVGGGNFVPLTGGTMTGNLWINGANAYFGNQTPPTGITTGTLANLVPGQGLCLTSTTGTQIAGNAYYSSANSQWQYFTTGIAEMLNIGAGGLVFSTAASGSANAAVTFTQAMTVSTGGALGVGTTPPGNATGGSLFAGNCTAFNYGANLYSDGTNWRYEYNGYGALLGSQNGGWGWYTAPSSTAGATAALSQTMTLSATGQLTITGISPQWSVLTLQKAASGLGSSIFGATGSNNRWQLNLGDQNSETGSNVGSDFSIIRYSDAGALIQAAIIVTRSNGACASTTGTWSAISDQRTKRNIADYRTGLADIIKLRPITFEQNGRGGTEDSEAIRYGFSAQEVEPHMPELVGEITIPDEQRREGDDLNAVKTVDMGRGFLAVVNALREISERLDALEAAR